MDIHSAYTAIDGLVDDDAQRRVIGRLADLQQRLAGTDGRELGFWSRFARRNTDAAVQGIYLWGGVGRGKTFLMDLFFETLDVHRKKRIHFHRMMSDVHSRLNAASNTRDPLDTVAAGIARDVRVLCFDEFFVSDIGDAMILGRLLDGLFRRGVTLVTTSNSAPSELYRDGLQRERFLPAIRLLESCTDVIELDAGTDYRLRLLQREGTYFQTSDAGHGDHLQRCFAQIAASHAEEDRILDIGGRPVTTLRAAKGVAWFDFFDICGGPRSPSDYIEIARWYQTVIISGVPVLTRELEDAARRFIALVDEFYDRRVKLILSAATSVDRLYQGTRLAFEFERTQSRLTEMQSREYLHSPHLA